MTKTITQYLLLISKHITEDISYGGQGTFHKYDEKTGEYNFDAKEAKIAVKALRLIAEALKN